MTAETGRRPLPTAPVQADLWSAVPFTDLPQELVNAVMKEDWPKARERLSNVMDGVTTDATGYGRELLQLVMRLPIGTYPVFDRYRASVAIDHGDWDTIRLCLASSMVAPEEIIGMRDIITAPLDRKIPPESATAHGSFLFAAYESQFQRSEGMFRRYAQRVAQFRPEVLFTREDIPTSGHLRWSRPITAGK